jgi:signal transduction histidine kinase
LRPPALDELGLAGALYEQAARYGATPGEADGLVIRVDAAGLPARLPAAVEVAAYRIAVEAMTNVVRHARARRCQVRLWLDGGLHIEVSDDGVGLPAAFEAGVGFRSMRERAEELGGTCQIQRAPAGGSQVRAHLPLAPALGEDG